ncbi:RHS repeat-associated core domain-containing protein [Flavobacterium sp.]|jgi:RHS repeat-associated protein|uniref:RHS repeat-associated core domain-containing protein n=1 Tax=Flavobacterium sp. TaxID=239 RepID=UPI0037BF83E3
MIEQHSYTGDYTNRYKFNGKELDEETGFYYYGARYYNPKFSIWLSTDPLAEQQPNKTPYHYCSNNPINRTDPTGMIDGEYEKNKDGKYEKTSTKGDAIGVDFYHSDNKDKKGNQLTYVTDRKGNWNVIKNGRDALRGEVRNKNVDWVDVYNEWKKGTGPARSIFEGKHQNNIDIHNSYLYLQEASKFNESKVTKKGVEINFGLLDIWMTSYNMQAQMMGSYNLSMYKLGDNILNIAQDSKSRTSFYYHIPFIENHERDVRRIWNLNGYQEVDNREANTYQTYIFMTTFK